MNACCCGAPIVIKKTAECMSCYHARRYRNRTRRPQCERCGTRTAIAGNTMCRPCLTVSQRPALYATPCTYLAAHHRVKAARGPAKDWRCIRCGARAEQWAYRAGSSRQITGTSHTGAHVSWSPDPADYDPMCRDCHGRATRPDYGAGYRNDPELGRAKQKKWRDRHYQKLTATPEGRQAYRDRKNREKRARRALSAQPHEENQR